MPEYVRVRDKASGHELSVIASAAHLGDYEVLDKPAAKNGVPFPPKHHKSPAPTETGRQAATPKENN